VSYISNAEGRDGVYELKTNGYMQGSINTAPLRSSFSFGLWMKQVSEPTGSCSVFQIGNSETNKSAFIAIEHPNKIKVGFYNVHELYASDVNAQDGWHYVVTTYDGTYLRLYIDGEFKLKSTNSTSDLNITDAVVSIGSHYGNVGNHFNGYVDDLFVYNRELTLEQIKTMYNAHMSSGKYRNNIIVSEEIKPGDKWKVCVTPNDNSIDGTEICSDLITITDQDIAPVHINNGNSIAGNLYDLNVNVLNGNTTDSKLIYNWYVDKGSGYMPIADMNVPMDYGENGATKVINYAKNEELNVTGDLEYHSTGGFDGKGCYKFSGNDFISTNADLNTNFTYGAWVKTTETTPDHSEATSGQSGISGVKYVFWPHSTGGSGVAVGTNGIYVYEHATNFLPCVAKYKADIGTGWNHIMVTYKNSVPTIYLNGEPVRIKTTVTKSGAKAPITIGCYTYGSFNGFIDDAVIYNRTLSAEQIKAMYNNYTSTNIYRNNIIVGQETNINEKWKVDVIQSEYDKIYNTFTSNEIVIGDPVINSIELNNNKTEINSRTGLEITKEVVTPDDVKLIYNWQVSKDGTNFNPVKIIDMPMDGGTLASGKVKDYIGGNHGTVNGATYQSDGGYDSRGAYKFNGTSDYIEIGDISGTESVSNITISAWVKTNKFEWGGVVDKRDNEGNNGWQLICGNGTMGNRFAFYIWTDDGYNSIGVFSNPGMETGKWYFLTVTYDGSHIKMYVNGEYHSHTAVTGNIVNSEAKVKIGSHHNTYFYDGFIDDVKIYNRTLTPYQVKDLCSGYNFNTQQFSEYSNNTIHHNETEEGDLWKVLVTPNDNSVDGLTKTSNQVTIVATPIMKSCNEFKAAGYTSSGNYVIDPDEEGSVKPFETYCDMTSTDLVSDAVSSNMALQSCLHHLVLYPDNRNKDGIYLLDSDGNGIMEPFKAYCDMTTDGGGWTLFTNIVDGEFDYNASISAQLGTDKLNESFVGSKPSNSVARLLVEGNGASYFKFDLVQDVPTGSYSPSTDSEFKVFEKGFNTVLSQTNAQLNVNSYPLYFETSKTGYGGGSMIKVSGANSTVLDGDGINFFWVLNQQISGGYNCKNTLTIGNLLTPNNHCTNKNATKFWLLYRERSSEYYGAEKSCNAHKLKGRSEDGIYNIDPDGEGGIEPFEAYCDMTSTDLTTDSESASTSLESCMQHLIYYPDNYTKDGVYMLDPDGKGGIEPFKAYCDMTAEGGGWTLLMKNTKNGTDFSDNDWISNSTINGEALSLANSHTDSRSKFNTYNYVKGTELKMTIKNPAQTWYHDMLVSQTALNWFSAGQMLINGSLSASCNGAKLHLAQNYNASLMRFGKAKQAYGFNITTSGGDGTSSWIWGFGSNDEHYNKAGVKVALLNNGSFKWSLQNDCSECSGCYGDGATEYTDSYSHMWIRDDESTLSVPSEKSCKHHYNKNRKIDGVYKIDPDGEGGIEPFTAYCDMTSTDFTTNSESASTSLESCMQHLIYYPDNYTKDGVYMLDPDGASGSEEPFKAYCDMTTEGGGWTLLMNLSGSGTPFGTLSGTTIINDYWKNTNTVNDTPIKPISNPTDNRAKYKAYNYVKGERLRLQMLFEYGTSSEQEVVWEHNIGDITALSHFSKEQQIIVGYTGSGCGGKALTSAPYYDASIMRFATGRQAYGFNMKINSGFSGGNWTDYYRHQWGFASNDEPGGAMGANYGMYYTGGINWQYDTDYDGCSGYYYGTGKNFSTRMGRLWIRDKYDDMTDFPAEKSCQHHYLKNRRIDGIYKIDTDGDGPITEFEAYCDMTTDDGGWTLVANMNKNDVLIATGIANASDKTQNVVTTGTSDIEFDIVREKSYEDFYYNFATAQKLSDGVDSKNPEGVTDAERLDLYLGKDAFNLGNDNCTTPEVSKAIGNGFYFSWSTYFNCGYKKGLYGTAGGGTGTNKWSTHVHPTGNYNGQSTLWIKNSKLKAPDISSFQTSSSRIEKGESVTLSWDVTDAVKIELISYNDGNFLEPSDVTGTTEKAVVPESDGTYVDYILRVTDDNGFISEKKLLIFFNKLEPYSLRFNRDLSNKLTITTGEQSSGNDFTFSVWVKLNRLDIVHGIFFSGYYNNSASNQDLSSIYISGGKMFFSDQISNKPEITIATIEPVITNDNLNEWHHLCYVMKNKVITMYFDGVEKATQFTRENQTELNSRQTTFGSNLKHYLGSNVDNGANLNYDGYMSDIYFINGSALEVSEFGEQRNGKWLPKQTSIANYGTNGFYLNFSDQTDPGKDFSGNGNNWIPVNYNSQKDGDKYIDQMLDSPTRNFAVLKTYNSAILSYGNLKITTLNTSGGYFGTSTLKINNNRYYWETEATYTPINIDVYPSISNKEDITDMADFRLNSVGYEYTGNLNDYSQLRSYGASFVQGSIIGTAIDYNDTKLWFAKDNVWQSSGDPSVGTNPADNNFNKNIIVASIGVFDNPSHAGNVSSTINFGQGGQLGLKNYKIDIETGVWTEITEGEIPDARFAYPPPTGFRPLSENFFIPQIEFTANRYSAKKGSNITLNWDIDYVTGITASSNDPNNPFTGSLEKKGTLQITLPDVEGVYKYTITANNDLGDIVTKNVTITTVNSYEVDYSFRVNGELNNCLRRTPEIVSSGDIWTYSLWVKKADSSSPFLLTALYNNSNLNSGSLALQVSDNIIGVYDNSDSRYTWSDPVDFGYSEWHHIVVTFDKTKATYSEMLKIYFDGVNIPHKASDPTRQFPVSSRNYPIFGGLTHHHIGYVHGTVNNPIYRGLYLSEVQFIDGNVVDISEFGESINGKWLPKQPEINDYGTNGFYLNFSDQTNPGKDFSGNGNDWTLEGTWTKDGDKYIDQMLDSPTRNFTIMNPHTKGKDVNLYEGNLYIETNGTQNGYRNVVASSFVLSSYNSWYFEQEIVKQHQSRFHTGFIDPDADVASAALITSLSGSNYYMTAPNNIFVTRGGATIEVSGSSGDGTLVSWLVDEGGMKFMSGGEMKYSGNYVFEKPEPQNLLAAFGPTSEYSQKTRYNFGQGGQSGLKNYKIDIETGVWTEVTDGTVPDARFKYQPQDGYRPLSENFFIPQISFTSNRYKAKKGSTVTLSWDIDYATKATASSDDPNNPFTGSLEANGSLQITLPDTEGEYKYTITAINNIGDDVTKTITIRTIRNYEVDYSFRFDSGTDSYLKRTLTETGDLHHYTYSAWIKRAGDLMPLLYAYNECAHMSCYPKSNQIRVIENNSEFGVDVQWFNNVSANNRTVGGVTKGLNSQLDWHHVLVQVDRDAANVTETFKVYIDGVIKVSEKRSGVTNGKVYSNHGDIPHMINNSAYKHYIGFADDSAPGYMIADGYMSEIHFIDGQVLSPSDFGELKDGRWIPKQPEINDYGTNGFYLNFSDQTNPGKDFSGNGNDWTMEGTWTKDDDKYIDQMLDSPTRNFNVLDFNNKGKDVTKVQEGNLYASTTGRTSGYKMMISTTQEVRPESSYYFEQDIISWKDTRYYTGFIGSQYNDQVPNYAGLSVSIPEKYFYSALDDRFFSSSGIYFDGTNNATVGSVISWLVDKGEVRVKRDNVFSKNGDAVFPKFNNNLYVVFGPQSGDQSNGKSDLQVTRYNFGQGGQAGLKDYKIDISTGVWTEVTDGSVPDVRFEYAPPTGLYPINDAFVSPDISSFTANPTVVGSGGTTGLEWTVTGSVKEELWLDGNKIANITGQSPYTVTPPEEPGEYIYTLKTYSGAGLISTKEVKVTVTAAGVSVESVQINDNNSEYRSNQRLEAVHTGLNPTDGNLIYNWIVDRRSGNNTIADVIIPFDGNTVNDKSGNNNNGALHDDENDGYNSNGKYGVGYEFDGVNDYIEMPTIGNLFNSDFSYSIWVYIPSEARTEDVSFFNVRNFDDNGSGDHRAGHIVLQPDDNIRFECKGEGDNVLLEKTKNLSLTKDVYLHFVVNKRGNEFRFYYNGEEQVDMRITTAGSTAIDDNNISLGRLNSNTVTEYFKGRVDELMIFDRALSSNQIKSVYDNGMRYIVPSETRVTDKWQVKVIPSNGTNTGEEKQSQQVTITASRRRLIVVETP
jgi:hypothetical protein